MALKPWNVFLFTHLKRELRDRQNENNAIEETTNMYERESRLALKKSNKERKTKEPTDLPTRV